MSISGISAASSAAYIQQSQKQAQASNSFQATITQTSAPTQVGPPPQAEPPQASGQVRHHHHHDTSGDPTSLPADIAQSGTASTSGANILNTLV